MTHSQERQILMGLIKKVLMLFGRQYVLVRASNSMCFRIKHAYCIAGRWYVHGGEKPDHYLLTNDNRVSSHKDFDPSTMVISRSLWTPITRRCDAAVRMYDD